MFDIRDLINEDTILHGLTLIITILIAMLVVGIVFVPWIAIVSGSILTFAGLYIFIYNLLELSL